MTEQENLSPAYVIPRNYEDSFITAGGLSFRSIGEGALLAALTIPIFIFLPIRLLYRAILIAVFGGALFAFGVIGIKHCYLSEFITKFFKFKRSCHVVERDDSHVFDDLIAETEDAETQNDNVEEVAESETVETDVLDSDSLISEKETKKKPKKGKKSKK